MSLTTRIELPARSLPTTLSLSDWILMPPNIRIALLLAMTLSACQGASETSQPPQVAITTTAPPTTTIATTTTTAAQETTTTTSTPRPLTPIATQSRVPADIAALVHLHFDEFGLDTAEWFLGIVWRESNGQPDAWNRGSGCYGLAQLALPVHAAKFAARGWDWQTTWMDADKNLTIAADIYRMSGRGPWAL